MTAVPALIEKVTGKKPAMEVHPDEVVTLGAALQGALLQIEKGEVDLVERESFPLVEIKDVNSHSMGVIALDEKEKEFNAIILKRNSPVRCKTSDVFHTVADNQTMLHVRVTEGEDADPAYVDVIGEATMEIPPYSMGAPVEVFFEYDLDQIIHVTVLDLTANKQLGEMQIRRASNLAESEVQAKEQKMRRLSVS